ncbi:MAG TPA: amidohydrolase family protein [Ktedonobacteraceae bacterium]|nr:amidohydrolase family protein [Ktedonobacteraceae bacterium]
MGTEAYRIDVHHHILPPDYLSALASVGITSSGGRPIPEWDLQSTLTLMDRHAIAAAITSISEPGVYFGDEAFARDLARRCNEFSAQLIQEYPQRFGAFAILPLPDIDAALRELEYALDTLKLDGVVLLSSVDGKYPGDPLFEDLFAELNHRKAVVFLHPTVPIINGELKLDLPPFLIEFVFDTTRAVTNLVYSGTLERCPDIRFIVAHAGGTVPYLAYRISMGQIMLPGAPQGTLSYLKQLYYDTALSVNPNALCSLQELVDASHILFGSDYPFAPEVTLFLAIQGMQNFDGFDEQARKAIERESALALFPRFQ